MSSTAKATFSVWKILGNLLALMAFAVLAGIGINTIRTNPRVGWFAAILFGAMCVIAMIEIVRICGLEADQTPPDVKTQLNIRPALIYTGSAIVAIFLGITDYFISAVSAQSYPRSGVWLGTFLTTLAFYPLQENKEVFPNFKIWTIYCALMGVVSVGISYLKDWIEQVL